MATHPAPSAPRTRRADWLSEELEAAISRGELATGDRLPTERELTRRFGVSRAAIREAIATLSSLGLVNARPGYRPIVQRPSYGAALGTLGRVVGHLLCDERGVHTLFETRIFIEAGLVRHAAISARRVDLDRLEEALGANAEAVGDPTRFYETDVAFHGVLYAIPDNPIYPAVHRAYVEWLMSHWQRMPRSPEIDRMNWTAHDGIMRAIIDRDADRAEQLLRNHLATAWEFVRSTFVPLPPTIDQRATVARTSASSRDVARGS